MKLTFKTLAVAILAAVFLAGGVAVTAVAQDKMMAHDKRVGIMKEDGKALGMFAKAAKEGDAAAAAAAAKVLVANSKALGDAALWPAGSGGGMTRAKMEIWDSMGDFKSKLGAFQAAAANAEKVAMSGDKAGLDGAFKRIAGSCGGCHNDFRAPEKK